MAKEIKPQATVLTAPTGETISYDIRNMFGIIFLQMQVNFDPLKYIYFAKFYISAIEGIRGITSISIDLGEKSGTYYFGITKNHNPETIHSEIEKEFIYYFKKFHT